MKSTSKLLTGVAALALIAGIGSASAQAPQQHEGKNNTPAPQSSQTQTKEEPEGRSHNSTPTQSQGKVGENAPNKGPVKVDATKPEDKNQRQGQHEGSNAQRQTESKDMKKDSQAQTETKKSGDTAAKAELNSDQRTKISQTIKKQNVKRVTNVNFSINVGTVVPRSYTFYPVPAPVVAVVPAYRGYLYIVVGDQMLILHPRTHEIVAVIPV